MQTELLVIGNCLESDIKQGEIHAQLRQHGLLGTFTVLQSATRKSVTT